MVGSCCVRGCANRVKPGSGLSFFRIPSKPIEKRNAWITAINRAAATKSLKLWQPSKHDRVCSHHFESGGRPHNDLAHPDYVPSKNLGYRKSKPAATTLMGRYQRRQERNEQRQKIRDNDTALDAATALIGLATATVTEEGTKEQDTVPKMKCIWNCHAKLLDVFYKYGHFLARHPWWFLIIPVLVCGGLAIGFLKYDPETDIETLYAPMNSRAVEDRDVTVATFPDRSAYNYDPFSNNRLVAQGVAIFRSVEDQAILTDPVLQELRRFYSSVLNLALVKDGRNITFEDVCVRRSNSCVVDGDIILSNMFKSWVDMGSVTYPFWVHTQAVDLALYLSDVNETQRGDLVSAGSFKISFPVRQDKPEIEALSLAWELEYEKFMRSQNFSTVTYAYAISQSLNLELDKGTSGDIFYFSLTFTLMITYASIVSSGGDCVSTRALLANAGVIAAVLGIMGAFGLITLVGVRFVNIVGVMPFLTLGIGVDDMFLMMSSWSETLHLTDLSVPERIGTVYKKAGIGITITSVTDLLAFMIGSSSVFRSVRNFCIYTGVGVFLCYICNATFFGACLTLHGKRVYASRHTITCKKLNHSRSELKQEGRKCCFICMCGGAVPEKASEDQSPCEKGPKMALPRFILWTPVRILLLLLFAGYLGVAIWGCTTLKQGLELKDLVLKSSYFHKFQVWDTEDFGVKLPVSFVTTKTQDYSDNNTLQIWKGLMSKAQEDPWIDPLIDSCWLFSLARTPLYNTSSQEAFFTGLRQFLTVQPRFSNDIVFGDDNISITASRCHAYSFKITDSNDQADLMSRMRDVADSSPTDVFAYHPAFVYFEQYLSVLPSTLMTVGVTLAVMFVVTCIFLPHPLIVLLVMIQVVMIVTGIFGFMAIWGLSLSSVTMIHLIMSVGFSVDFCAHVCTAYMVSEEASREDRAKDAIIHASGPILNGGLSSMIGVIVLLFTESYIFQSFFKIMLLVIGFGVLHAVFLIPVVLSFIGPDTYVDLDRTEQNPHTLNGSSNRTHPHSNKDAFGSENNVIALTPNEKKPHDYMNVVEDASGKNSKSTINGNSEGHASFSNNAFTPKEHLGYLN